MAIESQSDQRAEEPAKTESEAEQIVSEVGNDPSINFTSQEASSKDFIENTEKSVEHIPTTDQTIPLLQQIPLEGMTTPEDKTKDNADIILNETDESNVEQPIPSLDSVLQHPQSEIVSSSGFTNEMAESSVLSQGKEENPGQLTEQDENNLTDVTTLTSKTDELLVESGMDPIAESSSVIPDDLQIDSESCAVAATSIRDDHQSAIGKYTINTLIQLPYDGYLYIKKKQYN